MTGILRFAYRHIPSFRREDGGLHDLFVAVYHPTYVARMRALHRAGRHGSPMSNGRCTWCGQPTTLQQAFDGARAS